MTASAPALILWAIVMLLLGVVLGSLFLVGVARGVAGDTAQSSPASFWLGRTARTIAVAIPVQPVFVWLAGAGQCAAVAGLDAGLSRFTAAWFRVHQLRGPAGRLAGRRGLHPAGIPGHAGRRGQRRRRPMGRDAAQLSAGFPQLLAGRRACWCW